MIFRSSTLVLALALGLGISVAGSAFARVDVSQAALVPIPRILKNLDASVKDDPTDHLLRLNMARGYLMAYAMNADQLPPIVPEGTDMPRKVDGAPSSMARKFLAQASIIYDSLVHSADPFIASRARLGRAWCLEQGGNRSAAIAAYRELVNEETDARGAVSGKAWSDGQVEAAGYLIAMLNPANDAEEMALLQRRVVAFGQRPRRLTPIAIPLQKDTPLGDIEDLNARVRFDVDGRRVGQAWSWITPKAGWLAYDPKQTKKIDSGIRLFGNVSYWMFWKNGYQALAVLDDNRDGILTGAELAGLVVWVDDNRNGVCEESEVRSLAQLNIAGFRYSHIPLPGHPDRIVYSPKGVQYRDGSDGPSYDVILHRRP